MQQPSLKSLRIRVPRTILAALFVSGITTAACTQYKVAPNDGGDEHGPSGGGGGTVTIGMGGNTTGAGGSGGTTTGVDAAVQDAPMDMPAERSAIDAPNDTGSSLLANGASCSSGSQCQSKNCVDSFCCDSACSGQCQSCGESASPGKCVTISGAVRGQIRPTCTGTGLCAATCNGTDPNQCHFPGSEKQCADPSCMAGVAHAAATCDGAGNCPAGITTTCDPYLCGATACKTTCATSADCTPASYCSAPTCMARKGLGAVCGAGEQCTTGICGGKCCSSACTCPQPSATNLFTNAGFDSDLSDWGPTLGLQWSSQDADGCPYSGSIQVLFGSGYPQRCVSITPGAFYSIGGWFRNTDGALWICQWETFTDTNCSGSFGPAGMFTGSNVSWALSITSFQAPTSSRASLLFSCDTNGNTFVDKMFLTTGTGF